MTIIKNIESVEELNEIAYFPFIEERKELVKFDARIAYIVNKGLYSPLRNAIKNNIPLEQLVIFDEVVFSTLNDLVVPTLNNNLGKTLFPFSKKVFYNTFFSETIPTLSDSLYNLLKVTQRITPIGSGLHKAYIIDAKPFDSIPTLEEVSINPESVSSTLTSAVSSLTSYIDNAAFYEEKIIQRDKIIQQLLIEIEEIKKQVYSAYQTTWR